VPTILEKGAYNRDELLSEVGTLVKSLAAEQFRLDGQAAAVPLIASEESLGPATKSRSDH
jgi:hypothetical protein